MLAGEVLVGKSRRWLMISAAKFAAVTVSEDWLSVRNPTAQSPMMPTTTNEAIPMAITTSTNENARRDGPRFAVPPAIALIGPVGPHGARQSGNLDDRGPCIGVGCILLLTRFQGKFDPRWKYRIHIAGAVGSKPKRNRKTSAT